MNNLHYEGLIGIIGGIYVLLMAYGVVPKNPKYPERLERGRRKFGRFMKIGGPFVIISGFLHLFGFYSTAEYDHTDFKDLKERIEALTPGESITDPKTGQKIILHKARDGSINDKGWYPAISHKIGLSVWFPEPYNSFTQETVGKDNAEVINHGMSTTTVDGCRYIVSCTISSLIENNKNKDISKYVESFARAGEVIDEHDVIRDNMKGIYIKLSASQLFEGEFYLLKDRFIMIGVECPLDKYNIMSSQSKVYLGSIKFINTE